MWTLLLVESNRNSQILADFLQGDHGLVAIVRSRCFDHYEVIQKVH